jgi:hypothetical protein
MRIRFLIADIVFVLLALFQYFLDCTKSLQLKSFVECTGQLKKYRWMINPEYFDAESLERNVNSGFNNNLIFVVDKDKRGIYKRVNV